MGQVSSKVDKFVTVFGIEVVVVVVDVILVFG